MNAPPPENEKGPPASGAIFKTTNEKPERTQDDAPAGRSQARRPGISTEVLTAAGIRHADAAEAKHLVGYDAAGIAIPYCELDGSPMLTPDGDPFARLRLDITTTSAKYLSPRGSGARAYFPHGLRQLLVPGCTLGITEGEFKALALVEAGFAAVAIGGISSACKRNGDGEFELLPDLARLLAVVRPGTIAFCGDSDTALIPDFSREAVKIAGLVSVPVVLPRIPLDGPKAPDDLREIHGDAFPELWRSILEQAEPVSRDTKQAALAVRLLRREADALERLTGDEQDTAKARMVKMGVAFKDDALTYEELAGFAKLLDLGKQVFRSAVKAEAARQSDAAADARQRAVAKDSAERKEPRLVFDGTAYYRRELDANWGKLGRADATLHLGVTGFDLLQNDGQPSAADYELHRIQQKHRVNFAGPLCGRPAGIHAENGITLLATRAPKTIPTKAGDWPTLQALLGNLFGAAAADCEAVTQRTIFVSWLKLARQAVSDWSQHRPGQVLALVGPPDCGKSLLQGLVLTPALGGRVADPALWFTGGTTFNSELWGAEHLAIGDKGLGEDGRERSRLRDELKRVVASNDYPLHGKNKDALTLRPVWRVSLSANDDPESAISLPALDASFSDKIIYLRCYAPPAPFFDPQAPTGREDFARTIARELPAFLHAVDAYEIPAKMRKGRFGLIEWHHPAILDLIENGSALMPLGEVLNSWTSGWDCAEVDRTITSTELFGVLDDRLRGISTSPIHLGRQLSRLADTNGWRGRLTRDSQRVGKHQRQTVWKIKRVAE